MNRYVVGVNAAGKSDVLISESLDQMPEIVPGVSARDLWLSTETPADLTGHFDPVADVPMRHEPPDGGSIFRIMRVAPSDAGPMSPEEAVAMHAKIGSVHVPTEEELRAAKHHSMHRTDTLNYFLVLSGDITMLTEERDVVLRAGDAVVQKGCLHGWRNDSPEPCVLAGVMIDAKELT